MKNKRLRSQKGFAGADALIAVLIIALFSGLIASISYNIYLGNSSIKRISKANQYIVDMFEYVDRTYYDDITEESLVEYFNNKYYFETDGTTPKNKAEVKMIKQGEEKADTPFQAEINITKYNAQEGNTDKLDLVEEITMTVRYKLGNKDQAIEMKKTKAREKLVTPNVPDLSSLELQDGYKAYSIKRESGSWKVFDNENDAWYNYETGDWALVVASSEELNDGDEINIDNLENGEEIYYWIPRYAYNESNNDLKFLFNTSNNYVDRSGQYDIITPIDNAQYTMPTGFTLDNADKLGVWSKDTNDEIYQKLNTIYPLNK